MGFVFSLLESIQFIVITRRDVLVSIIQLDDLELICIYISICLYYRRNDRNIFILKIGKYKLKLIS